MRFATQFRLFTVFSVACAACSGVVGPISQGDGTTSDGTAGQGGDDGNVPSSAGGNSVTPRPEALNCKGRSAVGPAPLVRLTNRQYLNSLNDLFPGIALPTDKLSLPIESSTKGFSRVADVQAASASLIDELQRNAELVATAGISDLKKLVACTPTDAASEAACGRSFLAKFGKQVFRRPLTDEENTRYLSRFENARAQWGFSEAIGVLVSGLLQSPHFIYRPEVDAAVASDKPVPVGKYELASRLSYFLTDGPPDAALMATADNGSVMDTKVLEAQARRLMQTPRAHELVAEFHRQWLNLDKTKDLKKAADLFPKFDAAMAADLRQGVLGWLDRVFWDDGHNLASLLTDNHAMVNDALAPIYGVSPPGSKQLVWTEVPANERSGVLTQAGLLAAFAHQRNDAPVQRGVFVLDRLLCTPPPPAPPNVNVAAASAPAGTKMTTRQMLEQTHTVGSCVGCHRTIDGAGFGFGNYDALGAYRTTEAGQPVDASGNLIGSDVDGGFNGAVELGKKLAGSAQVQRCISAHWLAFALATTHEDLDECVIEPIVQRFASKGHDMRELLVAVATSEAFRFRPASNP